MGDERPYPVSSGRCDPQDSTEAFEMMYRELVRRTWTAHQERFDWARRSLHPLRILFLVVLFCLRAFLHLSEHFCHIFNLVSNIKSYLDRGTLLSRHRDTIAGPRIYLDDFFLLRFVLRAEDKS